MIITVTLSNVFTNIIQLGILERIPFPNHIKGWQNMKCFYLPSCAFSEENVTAASLEETQKESRPKDRRNRAFYPWPVVSTERSVSCQTCKMNQRIEKEVELEVQQVFAAKLQRSRPMS